MEKRLESRVREEINEFSQFSTWKDKEGVRLGLIGIATLVVIPNECQYVTADTR